MHLFSMNFESVYLQFSNGPQRNENVEFVFKPLPVNGTCIICTGN